MVANTDPRLKCGAKGTTLANRVVSNAECQRLFGKKWNTTIINGTATSLTIKKKNNHNYRYLTCTWIQPSGPTSVEVPLRATKRTTPAPPAPQSNRTTPPNVSNGQNAPPAPSEQNIVVPSPSPSPVPCSTKPPVLPSNNQPNAATPA